MDETQDEKMRMMMMMVTVVILIKMMRMMVMTTHLELCRILDEAHETQVSAIGPSMDSHPVLTIGSKFN